MYCPFCGKEETKVVDSRLVSGGMQIRRRRECMHCEERFTTYEAAELLMPKVIKNSGERHPFDDGKLQISFQKALEKRSVGVEEIENSISQIKYKLRSLGEREVSSKAIGELVMEQLKTLDHVAYIRFASVYRRFKDVSDFNEAITHLSEE